jgi:hypothetical protein
MKAKSYGFRESNTVSTFILDHLKIIPTPTLRRIVKQYERASQTNCPWYVYRSRGLADLAREVLTDRGWDKKNFPVAGRAKKATP